MLIGLVGKPSVGKSTFFKAATLAEIEIASYPFTTIKSNRGVGYVKVECIESEFTKDENPVKCNPNHGFCIDGKRFVPVELMDVAGLVPGASEGKGLGNQFLDDLRQADAFIQVVDASGSTDEKGRALSDSSDSEKGYDPCNDVRFLEDELDSWFFNILNKVWRSFSKKIESEDKNFAEAVAKQFSGLKVKEDDVKSVLLKLGFSEKPSSWKEEQIKQFASEIRKKSKPMIIAANKVDLTNGRENYEKLKSEFPDYLVVPCSSDSELALRQAAKAGLIEYIPGETDFRVFEDKVGEKQAEALNKIKKEVLDNFQEGTGVQAVLNSVVFDLLNYIAVFPASATRLGDSKGNILPDCFLLPKGSTALDFAYYLHTDFGKNFIKAIDARTKKALGKDYELKHRDALEIVTR